MGIGVFLIVAVAAVVTPDLFISVTKPFVHPFRSGISTGRGQQGILYNVVDALLLVLMVYSVCCIIVDYMKRGRDIYLMYVLAGVMSGILIAAGDILYSQGVINWHGGGYVNYSFSGFGLTIFLTLSMAEVLRQFLDQSRELERARKLESLGIFAGGIAHDFNNFLTSIMGSISIVKKGTPREDHKYQLLDDAERASRRARDLIQQLLTFSRGGAPVKTVVPIGDILHESVDFVLGGSDVRCEYSLPPDLWDIDADRGQIGQVIYNIVLNARQAMPRGGRITITAENIIRNDGPEKGDNRRFVRVCVKD
ncbi:MAG TPA: histidine kinase dimerization/phospho-acceptor domain-containing protein, partial [Spirochaetota bacterium]|nr:histidine kinase dimerization/phospho-acceptor domain-containing protein [Spirochaetota bacterium]